VVPIWSSKCPLPAQTARGALLHLMRCTRMLTPYGMNVVESCATCNLRGQAAFCRLSSAILGSLDKLKYTTAYPKGAVLFLEGQVPRGFFVLCQGRIKLSVSTSDGKVLILKIAEAGEALGLAAAVSGKTYEATAETQEPCQVTFIRRPELARLMREHSELALRVAEHLSKTYHSACRDIRALALSRSAAERFAKLLLEWSVNPSNVRHPGWLTLALSHEEIAQMIGTSRETVSRLFADFKKKQFIQQNGPILVISNRPALETVIAA
jgi:CRP/FNR family cyclic AMP-dependent transcriptional regulator